MIESAKSLNDLEVIREALGGSPEAFAEIVRRYQADVRMFVSKWIQCPATADDIAQEVFVAAYQSLDRFDDWASLKSWLIGIAKNKARLHLRSEARRQNHESTLLVRQMQDWKAQKLEGELSAETAEQRSLAICIEKLAPESKRLVKSHYFDGHTLESIARESNRTSGSLRMMLMRIRRVLGKCIRGQQQ